MDRSKRLSPIARVAERKEENAAKHLKGARDELTSLNKRLNDVTEYREEYLKKFHTSGKGMNATQMKDYRIFISKIDGAILQLQDLIRKSEMKLEAQRINWNVHHSKTKALDNVIDRYKNEEQQDEFRREDRESDDHTLRQEK